MDAAAGSAAFRLQGAIPTAQSPPPFNGPHSCVAQSLMAPLDWSGKDPDPLCKNAGRFEPICGCWPWPSLCPVPDCSRTQSSATPAMTRIRSEPPLLPSHNWSFPKPNSSSVMPKALPQNSHSAPAFALSIPNGGVQCSIRSLFCILHLQLSSCPMPQEHYFILEFPRPATDLLSLSVHSGATPSCVMADSP